MYVYFYSYQILNSSKTIKVGFDIWNNGSAGSAEKANLIAYVGGKCLASGFREHYNHATGTITIRIDSDGNYTIE